MKSFNKTGLLALAGVLAALVGPEAMAAVPAAVDTAVTAGGTDGASLVEKFAVAGAGVYILKRVLARFGIML